MRGIGLWLLMIFVVGTVSTSAVDYDKVKLRTILKTVPVEERNAFLRYALNHGYELVEGQQSEVYKKISPDVFKGIYQYFTKNYPITELDALIREDSRDVVCFPDRCIDIADPGVHP